MNATDLTTSRVLTLAAATMALVIGYAPAAAAQNPAAAPAPAAIGLTLDEAVTRALESSHRVGEGSARVDAARAALIGRGAADKPVISVLGGYTRTNHVDEYGIQLPGLPPRIIYPDVPDNVRARLDVSWPVYTSGRLPALERAAAADLAANGKDVGTIRADIRLDATRAFWTLAMAGESVRVVEESLKRVESHLKDIKTMRDVGLLAPNDVLTVEARRSRERVFLIEARNARDVAEADLRRATGLSAGVAIRLILPPDAAPGDQPDLLALTAEARSNRPERQALQARIQAVRDRHIAAAAGLKPVVSLVGGADYARPNQRIFPRAAEWNPSFDVGINVAWSLWDGGRVSADVAEADANQRAAEERLAELDRQLDFEVTERRLDLEAARASVGAATDGVTAAAEAHRVVVERFKAGLVSNTDVMDAQIALMQAQLDVTRATTAVRLSRARLDRTLGR